MFPGKEFDLKTLLKVPRLYAVAFGLPEIAEHCSLALLYLNRWVSTPMQALVSILVVASGHLSSHSGTQMNDTCPHQQVWSLSFNMF
jgi:hypothetical protein